ncbi:MAG TPA: Ig-like domain-containing protein, partial [Acidimicrobiia bacterium]
MTGSHRYIALGAVVVLLAGALTLALRSDTYHVTKYELHDSGIWGTRQSDAGGPIGRLNYEIQSVDMAPAVNPSTLADPDVVQNDANVVLYSHTTNMLAQVAVAQSRVQAAQPLPADSYVGIGSTRGVVFAPGSGSLWVTDAAALGAQSYSGGAAPKPLLTVGRRSAVIVGSDGTTFAYDPDRGVIQTIAPTGARPHVSQHPLRRIGGDGAPPITAVGDEAVILDAARHELLTSSGRTLTLPSYLAESTALQQPGGPAGTVLVASSQALATVSLHDGSIGLLNRAAAADGSYGPPVAPVALRGCEYGAWSEHGRYVQICPTGTPVSGTIDPNATAALPVTWRVNRGRVALNDQLDGTWVTFDPHAVLGPGSWLSAFGAAPQRSQTASGQPVNADCKDTRGPTTTPFDAGVRAGSSVVIPVLQHDVDPSRCHVLAIVAASTDVVAGGAVAIANSGRALLFTPAGDQTAALLNYTVSDGTREATGTVTVHVYGAADEKPPQLIPDQATVQRGHRVSFNVLANDSDREGDPIRLLSAHIDGAPAALQPTVRADGDVTVAAAPEAGNGQKIRVAYTATDERPGGVSTDGELDVTVQTGSVRPTAAADFGSTSLNARTATGTRELRVDLLANDSVGSGNLLTLVSVQPIAGQRFRILGDGELFFTPTAVGDFSTTYVVTDGIGPATGRLRIRVTKGGSNHPPVAIPDTAQLRSDGNATVDVLANDSDADDDVLFVDSVSVPPALAGSLQVAIVEHAGLRITAATHLTAPVTIGYTVTDGMASVPGVVTILPASSESDRQPPVAHDDQTTVRVNGAAEISVLENDLDPNGGSLSLDPKVPFTTLTGATTLDPVRQGFLYAHGNALRFVAPSTPGPVRVNYNVTNGYATSTAALTINVVSDDQQNQAPEPPPLIARVFAGSSTTLTIPLLGVDPENDPVALVGLGTPPSRGAVVGITGAAVTYRADPADRGRGGTDMFTYWLRDDHGALGEGTVLVAVSPPPLLNTPPVPENDSVRARPGRKIRIAVTANDIDADGDPISIPFRPTKPTNAAQPTVVAARTVEVSVPPALPDGTQITFFYAITDRINPQSALRGQVIVTVDRHARDLPVAVDDIVPGTRAPDPRATVKVPVLVNDFDPAYDRDQLKIQPSFNRSYSVDGDSIVIPVGTRSRLVSYCIQNPERETACAFVQITVGDPRAAPPVAVTDNASVSIGKSVSVDVTANDTHAPGTHLRVTTIVASHWGSAEVAAGRTVT